MIDETTPTNSQDLGSDFDYNELLQFGPLTPVAPNDQATFGTDNESPPLGIILADPNCILENDPMMAAAEAEFSNPIQAAILTSSVQNPSPTTSVGQYASSSLPATQDWTGSFNFQVFFNEESAKSPWTYSKNKLYIARDACCSINFSTNTLLPDDVQIRVMSVFKSPENIHEPVHKCMTHTDQDMKQGLHEAAHLIRCESSSTYYETDPVTGRHSTVVPFENPPRGQSYSTFIYKFTCFTSCVGGPNRRAMLLVFTLERNGTVLGRRVMDIKICACPKRDFFKAEETIDDNKKSSKKRKRPEGTKSDSAFAILNDMVNFMPPKKVKKEYPDANGIYTITVKDYGCYLFLKSMKKLYEMYKRLKAAKVIGSKMYANSTDTDSA